MRMGKLEKLFVNAPVHSSRVSEHAERMLAFTSARGGETYLDAGCGNGSAAIRIATKQRLWVTGVDVDPEQIRIAREAAKDVGNVFFMPADVTRLPFESGEFDFVATNKATHHIPNWTAALSELVRVLKPGGCLIYSDLVFPRWLASVAKRRFRDIGFPTAKVLDVVAKRYWLSAVHLARSPVHYEAVWRKPA